ncbi:hypothetical protein D3C80_1828300 [compost metagenome]
MLWNLDSQALIAGLVIAAITLPSGPQVVKAGMLWNLDSQALIAGFVIATLTCPAIAV